MVASVELGPSDAEKQSKLQRFVNNSLWLIGTSRNAILVVVTGVLGYHLTRDGGDAPFKLIGHIPPGMPSFQLPPFSTTRGNETLGFLDMASELGSGIIVLPLIALLENIAICKAFGAFRAEESSH